MPREVICSPSHIRNMVPPVRVITVEMTEEQARVWTMPPELCRPTAMPQDWNTASRTVR